MVTASPAPAACRLGSVAMSIGQVTGVPVSCRPAVSTDHGRPDPVGVGGLVDGQQGAAARRPWPTGPSPAAPSGTRSRARPVRIDVADVGSHRHLVEVAHGLGRGEDGVGVELVERRRISSAPNEPMRVRRRLRRWAPPPRAVPEVVRPAPGRRCPTSTRPRPGTPPGARGRASTSKRYTVTGRAGRSTSMPCAGQLVQPAAAHLHGRHHRRDLLDGAGQRRRPPPAPRPGVTCGHVLGPGDLARGVERGGGGAEHDLGLVGLGQRGEEAHEPGGPAQADQQHAGGVGVEGAGVADPALAEDAAAAGHHVVGGPAGLLVDHHQPGHLGRRRRSLARPSVRLVGRPARPLVADPRSSSSTRRAGHDGRVGLERRAGACASSVTCAPMSRCSCARRSSSASAASSSSEAQVHRGVRRSGAVSTDGHGDHAEALVGVGQALELLGQHLAQHLIDPQGRG